jgi:hypothetical protein
MSISSAFSLGNLNFVDNSIWSWYYYNPNIS